MADARASHRSGRTYATLAMLSVVVSGLVILAGWWPVSAAGPERGSVAWAVGVGLALVATLAGLAPAALLGGADPRQRLNGILAGMLVRFMVLLGGLLPMLLMSNLPRLPLAIGAVIGYIVLLGADTVGVVWLEKRARNSA